MDNETIIKRGSNELIFAYGESLLMNIKPDKKSFNMKIDEEELIRSKKENSYLISLLDNLIRKSTRYNFLIANGYFFILCNKNGYIIKLIYDDQLIDYFNELHFSEGNSLRIEDCGVNAVNLAMKHKRQAELCGKDHYCDLFRNWYCTAIPIFDSLNGEIIAYLDISCINISSIKEQGIMLKNIAMYIEEMIMYRYGKCNAIDKRLSLTEKSILSFLACGMDRKEIMYEMNISETTLRRHINKLKFKFKAKNDITLVLNAIDAGIIDTRGRLL